MRLRRIIRWLLGLGLSASVIVAGLVSRGVEEQTARDTVREVINLDRGQDTERVLIAVPAAQEDAANADIARLLCRDDVDGGDPAHAACLEAEGKTFSIRLCNSLGVHKATTASGLSLTLARWRYLRDNRDPNINYTVIRPERPLADLLAERGWRLCNQPLIL